MGPWLLSCWQVSFVLQLDIRPLYSQPSVFSLTVVVYTLCNISYAVTGYASVFDSLFLFFYCRRLTSVNWCRWLLSATSCAVRKIVHRYQPGSLTLQPHTDMSTNYQHANPLSLSWPAGHLNYLDIYNYIYGSNGLRKSWSYRYSDRVSVFLRHFQPFSLKLMLQQSGWMPG